MAGYIVFDSWPAKLSQKDQLIPLGYGGSAMPLEGACAEGFASLQTAFVVNVVVFSVASEQPGFLKLRICLYLQEEWETPLDLLSLFQSCFVRHSLTLACWSF